MLRSTLQLVVLTLACATLGWAQSPEKLIYSFNGTNGRTADSGLISDARGNVYGTTFDGGPDSYGTVFELTPLAFGTWHETVLYNFHGSDGAFPIASLTFDHAGNLYGTTQLGGLGTCSTSGGENLGCGVVFKLTPTANGWRESTLYAFQPGVNKGVIPAGGVIFDNAGNLYGTTWAPGVEGDFVMAKAGADPQSNTYWGCNQPGCGGTVYKLTPTQSGSWQESDIYAFTGAADGSSSEANLIMDNAGNLFGTTPFGGTGNCQYGCGTVFEVSPGSGSWTQTVLHSMTGTDGSYPMGTLAVDSTGNFYSTASTGGAHNHGAVFELAKSGQQWQESVLFSFTGGLDGDMPTSGVIFDSRGNLFGTAVEGGADSSGTVYELVHNGGTWSQVVLHGFKFQNDGQLPYGPPLLVNGWLVGQTQSGGAHNQGAAYQVLP